MAADKKEFQLWSDRKTKERYENLADLFAIIKTTDKLEKAWIRASSMPEKVAPLSSRKPISGALRWLICSTAQSEQELVAYRTTKTLVLG